MNSRILICFGIANLGLISSASAQYLGPADLVVSNGGEVQAQVVQWTGDPADLNDLYFISDAGDMLIGSNRDWESGAPVVDLGNVASGDEMLFGLYNTDTGTWFYTGPGDRNPDGDIHALVTDLGNGSVRIDFEDLASYQGSDFNYGDGSIVVTGAHASAVPAPAALGAFGVGILGALRRRARR
jgi:hypothetical protein